MNIPEQCVNCIHRKICEADYCLKEKECRERKEIYIPHQVEPKEVRTD